ncbi:hypothetical protein [Paenibacillus abyssi]|uniref:Uncharacterized protein n=1 Tax=Paenibacillus abyssi TaxID=1340531 RepID=A0A917D5Z8_9BACL|nr:hypothetical protein [Paenibacillus abyssi]GGG10898.1 hypothetical protein GCM10010916_29730 [Paenibacillus abyssi]
MKRDSLKWAVFGGVTVFMLLYGIEVATTGIETVYGPVGGQRTASVTELLPQELPQTMDDRQLPAAQPQAAVPGGMPDMIPQYEEERYPYMRERLPGIYGEYHGEPSVNRVAEQTAGLLQSLSSSGIRLVVSLFESVTN